MNLNESTVEDAALEWLGVLGYAIGHGPDMAPGEPAAERASFADVVLVARLRAAILRLNRLVTPAQKSGRASKTPGSVLNRHNFYKWLSFRSAAT